ncbi:MAG: DUF1700 domain-containing protein [Vallitalea sp.]|jgi:uncharacterized membrane protein|nr:DUF1700 domain-containing protein [Vallitalea sp.]
MNKDEYLKKLDKLLTNLPYDERRDIMYDYEEHFNSAIQDGKSQEEIAKELGKPERIALSYINKNDYNNNNNSSTVNNHVVSNNKTRISIPLLIIMLFFNIVFVAGIYIGIWGVLFGFITSGIAIAVSSIVVLFASVFSLPLMYVSVPFSIYTYPLLGVLSSVFLLSLGVLITIGTFYLIKGYIHLTIKYINWNKNIVRR